MCKWTAERRERLHGARRLIVLLAQFALFHRLRARWPALRNSIWRGRTAVLHALACAALGVAVECSLVRLGAFRHVRPDVAGLPLWLPALYMNGAALVGTVHDAVSFDA